jgi:predicted dehydrogenase
VDTLNYRITILGGEKMPTTLLERFGRKLRIGMVGGGLDSVIGETHRFAFNLDGMYELVAGCLSIDNEIAQTSARQLFINPERSYTDYVQMANEEASRDDGIDVIVNCTPPNLHLPVAQTFLDKGIHVISEKPLTHNIEDSIRLRDVVRKSDKAFILTHCYTGYPLVREMKSMVCEGKLGKIRMVDAEFSCGAPGVALEEPIRSKRHWHSLPEIAGKESMLGEMGSHAHNLACFILDSNVSEVMADLSIHAEHREVFDNAYLNVKFENDAIGRIWNSYVAIGRMHGLSIRVIGEKGALNWFEEEPEYLWYYPLGKAAIRYERGLDELSPLGLGGNRIRPGHPEGYLAAFAVIYKDAANYIISKELGMSLKELEETQGFPFCLPTVEDGFHTIELIDSARKSNDKGNIWIDTKSATN